MPGTSLSMGSQRVGHRLATKQQQQQQCNFKFENNKKNLFSLKQSTSIC